MRAAVLPAIKFSRLLQASNVRFTKNIRIQWRPALAALFLLVASTGAQAGEQIPNRLFEGPTVPETVTRKVAQQLNPPAPAPSSDNVVPAPSEYQYFPIRSDGQPYMLYLDKTINMTETLNRFYYDPKWRGELWVPEDPVTFPEKATRLLSTWQEYDQQNIFRVGNGLARFIEKMSGFGP